MRRWLVLLVGLSLCSCESLDSQATSASGVSRQSVQVATDPQGLTVEQRNVRERIIADNKPGAIKHLYVVSPYSGQVIIYSTVKGKVTSSSKRLSPSSIVVGSSGESKREGYDFNGASTAEVLGDDGTYGSSGDYLYWWDAKGIYHQHYLTGGQIVHVSDQPLSVKSVIINMEMSP